MESVLWFLSDHVGRITRPVKELKQFKKISLAPGESKTVEFEIRPMETLSYPDKDGSRILEHGEFTLQVGELEQTFTLIDSQ
jgi:beta-glucosidase